MWTCTKHGKYNPIGTDARCPECVREVKRIYPGEKNGLINWMEQNYHNIDSYIASFKMKDGTVMTIYSVESYLEAIGMLGISTDTIHALSHDGDLVLRKG